MTDNRTNEPTPEQVEAAAKALRADEGFMAEVHSALEVSWSEYIARLVLVAAQDAAPQAEIKAPLWGRMPGIAAVPVESGLSAADLAKSPSTLPNSRAGMSRAAQGAAPRVGSEELRDAIDHIRGAVDFQDAINPEALCVVIDAAILDRPKVQDPATTMLVAEAREWAKYDVTGGAKIVIELCDALTAAGAAPQAQSEYVYCPIHGDLLAARRSFVCEHAENGHEYAAPVQPSSTVDEAALIREAKAEAWDEGAYDHAELVGTWHLDRIANPYREGSET